MGKIPQLGIEPVDVAGQGGSYLPPYLNTSAEQFLTTIVDDHETIIQTRTCLALAELYNDPGANNFDCPWQWRNHYEKQTKSQDTKITKANGNRTNEVPSIRRDVENSS